MPNGERLKDWPWKNRYSSAIDDLIEDFYVPALSRSRFYYRIAGYFSTSTILSALKGISAFVEGGEKICMIVGNSLSKKDIETLTLQNLDINEILEKKWREILEEPLDDHGKLVRRMMGWLIAHGKLEIRVGINLDENGEPIPSTESIFHEKTLVFEDHAGDRLHVEGSINETYSGWCCNRESFSVHRSWEPGQSPYIESSMEGFQALWGGEDPKSMTCSLPEAVRDEFVRIAAPEPYSTREMMGSMPEAKRLRNYQLDAINSWERNGHVGILEMATGTGKTFTALMAIDRLPRKGKFLLIAVPQKDLALQWERECLEMWADEDIRFQVCDSDHVGWRESVSRDIRLSLEERAFMIIITTMATLKKDALQQQIATVSDDVYFIIDEVHEMGSEMNVRTLEELDGIKVRLGLSATPLRMWDEEGNAALQNYFGGEPVFKWGIAEAVNPPDGYVRCLSRYYYHFHYCHLEDDELEEYKELSKKISALIHKKTMGGKADSDLSDDKTLKTLFMKRSVIMKSCRNRYFTLREILDRSEGLNKCLIYCNSIDEIEHVSKILMNRGEKALMYWGGLNTEQRLRIFRDFLEGETRFLVAVKCLDQGVDLPICDSAIILSSCSNPREYVQRRGRVLRLHPSKEHSIIHDVLILPYPLEEIASGELELDEQEAGMIDKQIKRVELFSETSINKHDNRIKIWELGSIVGGAR